MQVKAAFSSTPQMKRTSTISSWICSCPLNQRQFFAFMFELEPVANAAIQRRLKLPRESLDA